MEGGRDGGMGNRNHVATLYFLLQPFNIHTHLKVIFMYDGRTLKLIVNDCTYRRHTSVRKGKTQKVDSL